MKKITILLFAIVLFTSCGISGSRSVLHNYPPTEKKVEVMGVGQTVPDNVKLIGNVSIDCTNFTNYSNGTYAKVVEEASQLAQQMGGDILYIVTHYTPDSNYGCHRIIANVYKVKE